MESKSFRRARQDVAGRPSAVELQSLRGIAAIVVLAYHAALYLDYGARPRHWMTVALNAHAAVVCFFVLSGFVLTLSLLRAPLSIERTIFFYVRRAFRIYPALWFGCGAAVLYFLLLGTGRVPGMGTDWARFQFAVSPSTPKELALAFAGLKPHLPVPIWSLAIELLASLAMPIFILAMRRSTLLFAMLAGMLGALSLLSLDRLLFVSVYLVNFATGAAIALFAPRLRRAMTRNRLAVTGAATGFMALWFARWMTGADFDARYHQGAATLLEGVGAAMVVATIYLRADLFRPLAAAWATRLGDRSYSLYLLHLPVLGTLAAVLAMVAPAFVSGQPGLATLALIGGTLTVTLPLADWVFRNVEMPAVGMGQHLLRELGRRLHPIPGAPPLREAAVPRG